MGCNNVKIIENNQISKKNENTKDLQDYPQFENSKVESNIENIDLPEVKKRPNIEKIRKENDENEEEKKDEIYYFINV